MLLNFGDRTRTGVYNVTYDRIHCRVYNVTYGCLSGNIRKNNLNVHVRNNMKEKENESDLRERRQEITHTHTKWFMLIFCKAFCFCEISSEPSCDYLLVTHLITTAEW
jgi:hypothetical protein